MKLKTHELINLQDHKLTNSSTYKLKSSNKHQLTNLQTHTFKFLFIILQNPSNFRFVLVKILAKKEVELLYF